MLIGPAVLLLAGCSFGSPFGNRVGSAINADGNGITILASGRYDPVYKAFHHCQKFDRKPKIIRFSPKVPKKEKPGWRNSLEGTYSFACVDRAEQRLKANTLKENEIPEWVERPGCIRILGRFTGYRFLGGPPEYSLEDCPVVFEKNREKIIIESWMSKLNSSRLAFEYVAKHCEKQGRRPELKSFDVKDKYKDFYRVTYDFSCH
jgi:hypothetical protein